MRNYIELIVLARDHEFSIFDHVRTWIEYLIWNDHGLSKFDPKKSKKGCSQKELRGIECIKSLLIRDCVSISKKSWTTFKGTVSVISSVLHAKMATPKLKIY